MLLKQNAISLAAFIAISICPSVTCQSYAGLVYQLVDYPQLQNGATLNGTVSLAENGILSNGEVVWEYFSWVTRSLDGTYSAKFEPGSGFIDTTFFSISIIEDALVLSIPKGTSSASLSFGEHIGPGPLFQTFALEYQLSTTPGDAYYQLRADDKILWSTPLPSMGLGETSLVIARLVPEPATVTLLVFGSLFMLTRRNRPN